MAHLNVLVGKATTWLEKLDALITMSVVIIMVTVPTLVSTWRVLIVVNVLLGTLSYLINVTVPEEEYHHANVTMEDVNRYALTHKVVPPALVVLAINYLMEETA